jgi:alpha-acetolactate decarboxylase
MPTTAFKRRSSFGIECVQCNGELIVPERSEYRKDSDIRHIWRCPKCSCRFESLVTFNADTKSMSVIRTGDVISP